MDLGVSLIKAIVTLFDYALYPFYMVIHRPWLVIKRRQKQRAWLSYLAKNRVLYKGVQVMNFFKSSEVCDQQIQGGRKGGPRVAQCPGPKNIRIKKTKCVFYKHTIKVCINCS